jgi:PEP-CTERM motif
MRTGCSQFRKLNSSALMALTVLGLFCVGETASADDFILTINNVLSGQSTIPSGYGSPTGPNGAWLTAEFSDIGANQVRLTLTSYLTSYKDNQMFVQGNNNELGIAFNYGTGGGYLPSSLSVTNTGGVAPTQIALPSANGTEKMDGDGEFDWGLDFATGTFGPTGATSTYTITGINGVTITADDFKQTNKDDDLHGQTWALYTAAHFQGIKGIGSTFYESDTNNGVIPGQGPAPVPEPGSVILLSVGAIGVCAAGWLRRRRSPVQ